MLSVLAGGIEAQLSLPRDQLVLFMPLSHASTLSLTHTHTHTHTSTM